MQQVFHYAPTIRLGITVKNLRMRIYIKKTPGGVTRGKNHAICAVWLFFLRLRQVQSYYTAILIMCQIVIYIDRAFYRVETIQNIY